MQLSKSIIKSTLNTHFIETLSGFHCISKEPLKESRWEDINLEILQSSNYNIFNTSSGSHKSGCDIECDMGNLSNKTGIIEKNVVSISSYRLTTVCNNKNNGNINNIISEINKRSDNFDYYSLLAREEIKDKFGDKIKFKYKWYLIPKTSDIFNPINYKWDKRVNKKNIVNGWKTSNYKKCNMKINFSMSSQLWLHINIDCIKEYIISEHIVDIKKCGNLKYSVLNKLFGNQ